jgi:hypothetical protein
MNLAKHTAARIFMPQDAFSEGAERGTRGRVRSPGRSCAIVSFTHE